MEPACTSPTAGGINYAKAQCMDALKEISQCYITQCAINNELFHIYSQLSMIYYYFTIDHLHYYINI